MSTRNPAVNTTVDPMENSSTKKSTCTVCKGSGMIHEIHVLDIKGWVDREVEDGPCPACDGEGKR